MVHSVIMVLVVAILMVSELCAILQNSRSSEKLTLSISLVSAIGQNILLYVENEPSLVDGTSASAPIIASIINLINERRLEAGKNTVGFIKPTLYKNPDAFTDVSILLDEIY
jgi:hypothetical protein